MILILYRNQPANVFQREGHHDVGGKLQGITLYNQSRQPGQRRQPPGGVQGRWGFGRGKGEAGGGPGCFGGHVNLI